MSGLSLELPTIQNWSCHSCGGCCRQHRIAITDAEHDRIAAQGWTAEAGIAAGQPLFVRMGRWPFRRWWRLAHQPDGRCVFLDDAGLCRIHAKFGEPAKPLACRIYPYAFHPKGRQVVVGLRFSCPSVVQNQGRSVTAQRGDLLELARQVVPPNVDQARPPELRPGVRLDWPDTLRVVAALDATIAEETAVPLAVRLWRSLQWLDLLEQARLSEIRGERLDELLNLLRGAADVNVPADTVAGSLGSPSAAGLRLFRLLAGQYARIDNETSERSGWRGRWRLFWSALRLARGGRLTPELSETFAAVPLENLEQCSLWPHEEVNQLLTRYLRVKLAGMSFCGRAYYGVPVIEGFRSLVLVVVVVHWLARWRAVAAGRDIMQHDDFVTALTTADHHHGYSPALGTFAARGRVRSLHKLGDVPRLIARYVAAHVGEHAHSPAGE